jgi:hypothetical protein
MSLRFPAAIAVALLIAPSLSAKEKLQLPQLVLNAETVYVVIHPGSEVPLANPGENRQAEIDVENALRKWGRFHLVIDPQIADLVISVRKGRAVSSVIGGVPNTGPVMVPGNDGNIGLGGSIGRRPDVTQDTADRQIGPGPGIEFGSADDTFEVYRGRVDYPLDTSPLWRYSRKDALRAPQVEAVEQFKKTIEDAQKQLSKAKKKGP